MLLLKIISADYTYKSPLVWGQLFLLRMVLDGEICFRVSETGAALTEVLKWICPVPVFMEPCAVLMSPLMNTHTYTCPYVYIHATRMHARMHALASIWSFRQED